MDQRNRGWRQWQRQLKMMRRLKEDWNQHCNDLECPCRVDPIVRARFADTPASCSCHGCGNVRRVEKGKRRLTRQERLKELTRALKGDS
jgi:hypothetical protein